jgi:MYXO-CTERM domain-containing protein
MAGYDPKQKRAHSAAAPDGPAPVDDLLGAAAAADAPVVESAAPRPAAAPSSPTPLPPVRTSGPDPKVLAVAVGAAVLAILWWRRRR